MKLSDALSHVKMAMMDTSQKTAIRHLNLLSNSTPCKASCSACCSRLIYVSVAESLIMLDSLIRSGVWDQVRDRAKEQVKLIGIADRSSSWFKMNKPCPILNPETKLCLAYEVRPSPCSTHFVKSNPNLCDPWSTDVGEFKPEDMVDLHEQFLSLLEREVAGRGILRIRLPIPVALLFAEKIQIQTNLSFDDIIELINSELG